MSEGPEASAIRQMAPVGLRHPLAIAAAVVLLAALVMVLSANVARVAALLVAVAAGLVLIALAGRGWLRVLVWNLAFAVLALALVEGLGPLLRAPSSPSAPAPVAATQREGSYLDGFHSSDADLGYAIRPIAGPVRSILKNAAGRILYDVTYSIDAHGHRVGPDAASPVAVHFYGCSFTFGEGVDDAETLPVHVQEIAGWRATNLGVPGYGSHQMLRQIETDRAGRAGAPPPAAVVYTLLTGHIDRAAGRAPWDAHGPLFEADGLAPRLVGPFDAAVRSPTASDPPTGWRLGLQRWLAGSYIYRTAWLPRVAERERLALRAKDRARVLALVVRARDLLRERHRAPLLVVLWDTIPSNDPDDALWLATELRRHGIDVRRASEIAPGIGRPELYLPVDGHPTGAAYRLVAEGLVPLLRAGIGRGRPH